MSDLCVLTVSGRLTRQAETKLVGQKNSIMTTFAIANNTGYGEYAKTQFYECVYWGVRGQSIVQYLTKGKPVIITGVLENNKWQGTDGLMHDKWQITCNDVVLLPDGKPKDDNESIVF